MLTCFFMAGMGNWGWVFAQPVMADTGVNGLRCQLSIDRGSIKGIN